MFSKFFIERPVLANVIAVVTMLLGVVALWGLPVAQYPRITPPSVVVSASYPGANPMTIAETVGAPIEQQVNGVENMLYMSSRSSGDGSYALTVLFEVGTNLDMATVMVQNRVNSALSRLPEEVQRQGVTVKKTSSNILLVITLDSEGGRYDSLFISNFASLRIKDELSRIPGVGDVNVFGADEYGMRLWLDPTRLKALRLSPQDVINAVNQQNLQVAGGQVGQPPIPDDQNFQYTIQTQGRLSEVSQFEDIIIKTAWDQTGKPVKVKDVARVELGGRTYDMFAERRGHPAGLLAIYLLPGANALDVATLVKAAMQGMTKDFPPGLKWEVPFDTTRFVESAVDEVYRTLLEAALLVLLVIMLFLQNWRAMLVPATTVPVTILGSFIAMYALGFSVNLITLFGVILAIGIVVDDAIIVVEGAAHHMERGATSKEAAIKAMSELFGPIVGVTLVLCSVFLPASFMPGITGQLYRQFALVIAATAVISAINAATLKPTQCALWLRLSTKRPNAFYRGFNRCYAWLEEKFLVLVGVVVRHTKMAMIGYLVLIALAGWGFSKLPTGFLPTEDQGYAIIAVQLPPAASQVRTREVVRQVDEILKTTPGIRDWITFGGMSVLDGASLPNAAAVYVIFDDWHARGKDLTQEKILANVRKRMGAIQEAMAFAVIPPAIQGLGSAGGFEMVVLDRGNLGPADLEQALWEMAHAGAGQPALGPVNFTFSASTPQVYVDVDRSQALNAGVPLKDLFTTLQTYLGSSYINDFNKFGRVYQVRAQAEAAHRLKADDIRVLEVRNSQGKMVPLGSLVQIKDIVGPQVITRYNLYLSASLIGSAAAGFSSGQALDLMEQMAADKLPQSMGFSWTGMSYQEKKAGHQAYFIFAMAVLLVYLVLAAQYESWTTPLAVILVVPLALLGTLVALWLRGMDNNIYTQIGLVLLIALSSKNAILIVEFARELRAQGATISEAALTASRLRFRPILMTSFAFILGVVPLLTASGAGAASQRAVGTAVFGGMIASTVLAVLIVPVFFVVIQGLSERYLGQGPAAQPPSGPEQAQPPAPDQA
ncbi:MAG: multidrug efflux RND transporter permease subunit [Desulfarculus sp.]|nr:multidrug efflux RND transporter permease subunit [Desulfarculus sp.]